MLAPALALAMLGSGCDDEPDCRLETTLGGAFQGPMVLSAAGREGCGFAQNAALYPDSTAIAFIGDDDENPRSVYVIPQTTLIEAGNFPGRVKMNLVGNSWESAAPTCTISILDAVQEDWTKIDFILLDGVVSCPDPLISASPDFVDVTMAPMGFEGHLHAELLDFDFQ